MEDNVLYTHELRIHTTKVYEQGVLSIKGAIKREFEDIDSLKPLRSTNGMKFVEVTGTMHLYGYKVATGGFFDLLNLTYYPEYSKMVTEGTISDVNLQSVPVRSIRTSLRVF